VYFQNPLFAPQASYRHNYLFRAIYSITSSARAISVAAISSIDIPKRSPAPTPERGQITFRLRRHGEAIERDDLAPSQSIGEATAHS
jgi:hypothetical protein